MLCKPNKGLLLWWVRLSDYEYDWFRQMDAAAQAVATKQLELVNKPTMRGCQTPGRTPEVGHRMPQGGTSGRGFGSANVTLEPTNVPLPSLLCNHADM